MPGLIGAACAKMFFDFIWLMLSSGARQTLIYLAVAFVSILLFYGIYKFARMR